MEEEWQQIRFKGNSLALVTSIDIKLIRYHFQFHARQHKATIAVTRKGV